MVKVGRNEYTIIQHNISGGDKLRIEDVLNVIEPDFARAIFRKRHVLPDHERSLKGFIRLPHPIGAGFGRIADIIGLETRVVSGHIGHTRLHGYRLGIHIRNAAKPFQHNIREIMQIDGRLAAVDHIGDIALEGDIEDAAADGSDLFGLADIVKVRHSGVVAAAEEDRPAGSENPVDCIILRMGGQLDGGGGILHIHDAQAAVIAGQPCIPALDSDALNPALRFEIDELFGRGGVADVQNAQSGIVGGEISVIPLHDDAQHSDIVDRSYLFDLGGIGNIQNEQARLGRCHIGVLAGNDQVAYVA